MPANLPQVFLDIIAHDARRPVLSGPVVALDGFRKWAARKRALTQAANLYRKPKKPGGAPTTR